MKANKKIRILHLQLLPMMSGVQKVALDEMTLIDRNHFEPLLVCKMPGEFTETAGKLGVECHYVDELQRAISPVKDLKALYKLYRLFKELRPDVVHTHSSKTGVLGRIAAKFAGVPAVMHTVHGFSFDGAGGAAQRAIYLMLEWISARFCDAILLLKNADLELTRTTLGVDQKKLHLIPNGVSMTDFAPQAQDAGKPGKCELLGCNEDDVTIAMTGRLWEQKNPECFVRAAIEVLKSGAEKVRFYLIGDGPLRETLQHIIDASGFSEKITILGWRSDVKALLQVMDVFVLPSRWEGLPLAILEAMSTGLPVIASDIPGNNDLVEDGVTGYLFERENHQALAARLNLLLSDPVKRTRFGIAARTRVVDHYRIENRVSRIERLYVRLLTQNGMYQPDEASGLQDGEKAGRTAVQ